MKFNDLAETPMQTIIGMFPLMVFLMNSNARKESKAIKTFT